MGERLRRSVTNGACCGALLFVGAACLASTPATPAGAVKNVDYVVDFTQSMPVDGRWDGVAVGSEGLELSTLVVAPGGRQVGFYDSGVVAAPFDFTAVGPHWRAEIPEGSEVRMELSTSPDGVEWSTPHAVFADTDLVPRAQFPDGSPNPNFGDTMGGLTHRSRGDGRFVRFWIYLERDAGASDGPRLSRFALAFIDSRLPEGGAVFDPKDRGASTQVEAGLYPKPPVNSRAAWGARPPNCTYQYCNVTHIAIHHTAGVSEYSCSGFDDCAADVRAIQSFHMDSNGWCDVGYQYLASSDGQLWEGRGGGDDVKGAHDGHNCGSMAISNMGFYHTPYNHLWTEAQLNSVAELTAWKVDQKGIDPYGVSFYAGFGANMDNIYGHRDVSATSCPGDTIHPRLDELKDRVDGKLNGGGGGNELIFDNPAATLLVGPWETGTSAGDKYGSNYYWTSTATADTRYCAWQIDLETGGTYDVSLWWPQGGNRTPEAEVGVKQSNVTLFSVNQQVNGGQWNSLGSFSFNAGDVFVGVRNGGPAGWVVMCDAVRLTKLN